MQGKELFAAINSGLNATSAVLLIIAYVFIRNKKYFAHGMTMSAALLCSAAFLSTYLYSKYLYGEGSTGMPSGWFRTFYYIILFPHVLLAVGMLPLIGLTVFYAVSRKWEKHRKIAKPTLGIWLYVSITGVLIYFILYQWYPALYPDAFSNWKQLSHSNQPVNSITDTGR